MPKSILETGADGQEKSEKNPTAIGITLFGGVAREGISMIDTCSFAIGAVRLSVLIMAGNVLV